MNTIMKRKLNCYTRKHMFQRLVLFLILLLMLFINGCAKNKDKNQSNNDDYIKEEDYFPTTSPTDQVQSTEPAITPSKEPDYYEKDVTGQNIEKLGAILIVGDSGYEYYSFNKSASDHYVSVINKAAKNLQGISKVYNMIVPNSMDILLPQSLRNELNTSDQKKALDYMYYSMDSSVNTVPIFTKLKEHAAEYIFFRTDHHWTALGAYYAYEKYCEKAGLTPLALTKFKQHEFTDFIGSFYSDSGLNASLKKNPDKIIAYEPKDNAKLIFTNHKGEEVNWHIISDVSTWKSSTKYSTFAGGDNPYTIIHNNDLDNGKSVLLIKESYGNAFVPFLVPHYETVHVIDYRYWKGNLYKFVKDNKINDVIFQNTITMTSNDKQINLLDSILK